jgi:hypothetical protein
VGIAGDGGGGGGGAVEGLVVAVNQVDEPRGPAGERHDCVELVLREQGVDAFLAREADTIGAGLEILRVSEWASGFRLEEKFLLEERHLALAVLLVEIDQLFQ